MSKAIKWIIGIIVALAVVAGGGYFYLRYTSNQASGSALANYTFTRLATGNIDTTVSATGSVRTAQNATLTWSDSGRVGKVNVKVGDTVKANDVLASLDPTNLPNDIIQAQQALVVDTQALSDLQNNKTSLPTLQKAVIDAQTAVTNAQTARDNLNFARATDQQIAAAQAALTLANQKLAKDKSNYDHIAGDPTTDARKASAYAAYLGSLAAQTKAQNNLDWLSGAPSASDIATADNTLALAKAQLADAQRALSQAGNGVDPSQLAADQAKIAADQSIIDSQNIRAPFSGTITTVTVMPGDVVSSGTNAFRIDDTSAYYIDLAVSEIDISNVQKGEPVTFTFDAVPNKTYNGIVTNVSQVGTTTSNVVNFTVTTQITDADASIKPGITSSGSIVTNSVKNVLVVPTKAIKKINGKTVVYEVTFTGANGAPIPFGSGTGGRQRDPRARNRRGDHRAYARRHRRDSRGAGRKGERGRGENRREQRYPH